MLSCVFWQSVSCHFTDVCGPNKGSKSVPALGYYLFGVREKHNIKNSQWFIILLTVDTQIAEMGKSVGSRKQMQTSMRKNWKKTGFQSWD